MNVETIPDSRELTVELSESFAIRIGVLADSVKASVGTLGSLDWVH